MKNKAIQKFSPFALGVIVLISQIAQGSMAYGASLSSVAATDNSLLKPNVSELQPSTSAVGGGCAQAPIGGGSVSPKSSISTGGFNKLKSPETLDPASVLASSATGSVVSSTMLGTTSVSDPAAASTLSSTLVAQAAGLDDCCEIGGTTTCEVGGLPPAGGGALAGGLSPLAALAGLPLAGLIPLALGGGNGGNGTPPPPVPEPTSTAAITAGLGLLGLWYGRRYRSSRKVSV